MFTGLIEDVGKITSIIARGDVTVVEIGDTFIASELKRGSSVAVSGACLTVVEVVSSNRFKVEIMEETRNRTTLSKARIGLRVNLERALPVQGRFDGHIVTGHVDTLGEVVDIVDKGRTRQIFIKVPSEWVKYIVEKGSVAVDGVSLTVISVEGDAFSVGLIPTTLADTTIGSVRKGDRVNIECDILAKYIARLISSDNKSPPSDEGSYGLSLERLRELGW